MPRRSARPEPDRTLGPSCQAPGLPSLRRAALGGRYRPTNRRHAGGPGPAPAPAPGPELPEPPEPPARCPPPPRAGGRVALPQHEPGLDVIAAVGRLRHAEHRSVTEVHAEPARRGVAIRVRGVGDPLGRCDELLALSCPDAGRVRAITARANRVILAIDGLRPDVGREALRVLRDVLSGEAPLARSLLPPCQVDPAKPIEELNQALGVPITGVVSDGRPSVRRAAAEAPDGVPHHLRHLHYLRESARPVRGAGRHAGVRLKKEVRGVRPTVRKVEGRDDDGAEVVRGYRAAVRSALTDDGRPPPEASGLKPAGRLTKFAGSLGRVGARRGSRRG